MDVLLCGWTRDVDWGNAPSWAAVLVAATVGSFSVRGLAIARTTYQTNVWNTTVAQARRVYAHVERISNASQGNSKPLFGITRKADVEVGVGVCFENGIDDDTHRLIAKQDTRGYLLQVVNRSNEPIGSIELELIASDGTPIPSVPPKIRLLKPGEELTVIIWTKSVKNTTGEREDIRMWFTDSAGQAWYRVGTNPPEQARDC